MSHPKFTEIYVELLGPKNEKVKCQIVVRDGYALSTFSHPTLAEQLFQLEQKKGTKIYYSAEHKTLMELYPGMKTDQIIEKLKKELQNNGARVTRHIIKDEI